MPEPKEEALLLLCFVASMPGLSPCGHRKWHLDILAKRDCMSWLQGSGVNSK